MKKIVFISSSQEEFQAERDMLRENINEKDDSLSKLFMVRTFEKDLSGRKESVGCLTKDQVLKSDVYLGLFGIRYSEPTIAEYEIALGDRLVKKEMILCVKSCASKRESRLEDFLSKTMNPQKGHSCLIFKNTEDLLKQVKSSLMNYIWRMHESFIISKETLGPNLDKARATNMPEEIRRKFLAPIGRWLVPVGRKGVPEYYRINEIGEKIDITWEYIQYEPNISEDIKAFYKERYNRPF